jgi:hypothetical protein
VSAALGVASQEASRSANERFRSAVTALALADGLVPFLCECADWDCLGRIEMTLADYAAVHDDREVFVIMLGHATVDGERPLETRELFEIVRKPGAGA